MTEWMKISQHGGCHALGRSCLVYLKYLLIKLSATNVPLIACVINLLRTFAYYLDVLNVLLECGLSYFRALLICLLLVCFVSDLPALI